MNNYKIFGLEKDGANPLLRIITSIIAFVVFCSAPAYGQLKSEGRKLAELTFQTVDQEGKGHVDLDDMEKLREQIFTSADADENELIDQNEFLIWDYGFSNIAADQGKTTAYRTALKVVFSFWDRDSNGQITVTEHRKSMVADFNWADLNDDSVLDEREFLSGLSILVAIRSVLKAK